MEHTKPKFEYLAPSGIDAEYQRYLQALAPCQDMGLGQAYALPAGPFHVGNLRKLSRAIYGAVAIIDHKENGLEVRRLENEACLEVFYAMLGKEKIHIVKSKKVLTNDFGIELLNHCISKYFKCDNEVLLRYDKNGIEFRGKKRISRIYLQRNLQPLARVKTVENFNSILKAGIEAGILREYAKSIFDIL